MIGTIDLTKEAAADLHGAVLKVAGLTAVLQLCHWQAPTRTNEHAALGGLYSSLSGLVDTYAEALMGETGSREFPEQSFTFKKTAPLNMVEDIRSAVKVLVNGSKDESLLNIAADMLGAINKALYLLQ